MRNQDGFDWYAVAGFTLPIVLSAITVIVLIVIVFRWLT